METKRRKKGVHRVSLAGLSRSLALLCCCLLNACEPVTSVHGLGTPEAIVSEPELEGAWGLFDGGHLFTTITVESAGERTYRGVAKSVETDRETRFSLVLVRLNNELYADISVEPKPAEGDHEAFPGFSHIFCRVAVNEQKLTVDLLLEHHITSLLEERKLDVTFERSDRNLVLTSLPGELRSFLARRGSEMLRKSDTLVLYRQENDSRLLTIRKEVAENPGNPEKYRILGELTMDRGQYEDARAAFERALALNSKSYVYREHLSKALVALGLYEDARNLYNTIEGGTGFGETYYLERRYMEAAKALEHSGDSYSVIWRSLALEHLGKQEEAYRLRSEFHSGDKKKGEHGWAYDPSDFLNGRTTEREFLARAKESGEDCLGLVIIAERQLLRGQKQSAHETLAKAVGTKRYGDFGCIAARALLASLPD